MRGEWIKLLSLRSTWWALASTAAVITLVALATAASLNAMADDPALAPGIEQMHGAEVISSGFHFGMLTIAVLGALLITGEYATGSIRSTFAAVPTRIPVLAAKALTLVVLTAAVTLVSVTLSYFVTMPQLSQYDLVPALDDPGTWRVFGGTLYSLIAAALFSLGIGTLLRSTAASLTAALTVLLLLPGILSFIRLDWVETIVSYLPLPASSALLTTGAAETQGAYLSTQASLIVMAAYAVVPIAAAASFVCFGAVRRGSAPGGDLAAGRPQWNDGHRTGLPAPAQAGDPDRGHRHGSAVRSMTAADCCYSICYSDALRGLGRQVEHLVRWVGLSGLEPLTSALSGRLRPPEHAKRRQRVAVNSRPDKAQR
jgi:ABC-2 type transport system permease protein